MAVLFSSASVIFSYALFKGSYLKLGLSSLTGLSGVAGIASFHQFAGGQLGTVYFCFFIATVAWLLIFRKVSYTPLPLINVKNVSKSNQAKTYTLDLQGRIKPLVILILSGVLGMLAVLFITLLLPIPHSKTLAVITLLFPLGWAIYVKWNSMANHLLKAIFVLLSLSVLIAWNIFGVMS
ncbi:hypothetical protein [Thalassotalea marina]|uniref:Uncharacterized protein n=1 Tax=Thalassotalea marina TaxID=1673741 RepID=A0A919BPV4_9GAMM|nr:hypothetical protein [Thalassotalea marina]GHG03349.1 hypothetical protein GCM10017161_35750 [Thalassotalea marina]